ncbi:MAG: sugar phosphate isomerase/epimerase family protein [Candidatus Hydrogenedentes bacterium]|nr:sugar phosphate isomerase/epimerase family protein [Candidatus Hydrogenedentota bacterium]
MSLSELSRRSFIAGAAALGAGALLPEGARAASPVERVHGPYMKLSLAAYSFHRMLPNRAPAEEYAKADMNLEDFVRYCAELNLDGCEPTSYYFPAEVTPEYLLQLKQLTFRLGLDISGTAIGNNFCVPEGPIREEELRMTREWIDHAALLGAPVIRIFAGEVPEGDTEDAALERCISAINESLDYAAQKGVVLALENHGGITATGEHMLRIIKGVKESPWFGVNFDGGNFHTPDPYADMAQIAPYTVNAQIKVSVQPNGKKEPADFARVARILQDAGYRGYLVLEYEDDENPKEAIPRHIDTLRKIIGR